MPKRTFPFDSCPPMQLKTYVQNKHVNNDEASMQKIYAKTQSILKAGANAQSKNLPVKEVKLQTMDSCTHCNKIDESTQMAECSFCDRKVCVYCLNSCYSCEQDFCPICSVIRCFRQPQHIVMDIIPYTSPVTMQQLIVTGCIGSLIFFEFLVTLILWKNLTVYHV